MTLSASSLVSQASGLYALPEIYAQLNSKLEDPHASNPQIADIIQLDSGLSSSLLKIVNSAFYGFPSTISTISQAISIIGRTELAELVLGKSVINIFSKLAIKPEDLGRHWRHSLLCGLMAKHIVKTIEKPEQSPDSLFVAGLLHDIGKLIIWHELPEQSVKILEHAQYMPLDTRNHEKEELGFDHTDVGQELLQSWKLPPLLVTTTKYHHKPEKAEAFQQACQVICMANVASHFDQIDTDSFDILQKAVDTKALGIDLDKMIHISEIANEQLSEMSSMFLIT